MIVVTGAAGFIGSCLVAELNSRGRHDLIVVDHYKRGMMIPRKRIWPANAIIVIMTRQNI